MEIQRILPESMIRIIWYPTCPNYREDRHRSGQVPDRRRTTIGGTARGWKTVEDLRSCFTAWTIWIDLRRAKWEATAAVNRLSNQTEPFAEGPWPEVAKADTFAAIPLVILRSLQASLHNPQYRQPAVLDFIKMRTVTILFDPSDEMNTSLLGDVLVVDPVKGP